MQNVWPSVVILCSSIVACDNPRAPRPPHEPAPLEAQTGEQSPRLPSVCEAGALRGKTCAPSRDFVSDATVVVTGADCLGNPFRLETLSDPDGEYFFPAVPAGIHELVAEKGSFSQATDVAISAGHVTDTSGAANKLCFASETTRIAVLEGDWDDLGSLVDGLGFVFDFYTEHEDDTAAGTIAELFADPSRLARYDVVFAACGHAVGTLAVERPEVIPVVRDFVLRGGSIYMSDYAWTLGEAAFPNEIEFVNDDAIDSIDDMNVSPQQIPGGTTVSARIDDEALAAVLGRESLAIRFDEGPQIAAQAVGGHAVAIATADIPLQNGGRVVGAPLAVAYTPGLGSGRVVYTNFHNDAQSTADMQAILRYLVFSL